MIIGGLVWYLASDPYLALIAATFAAAISCLVVLRTRSEKPTVLRYRANAHADAADAGTSLSGNSPGAAAPPRPAPPRGMAEALRVIERILDNLQPGPEQITAADPDAIQVRWDDDFRHHPLHLPGDRRDKMLLILTKVRNCALQLDVLHQLPQLLLVAEDGAAIELFGQAGTRRYGVVIDMEAPLASSAAFG